MGEGQQHRISLMRQFQHESSIRATGFCSSAFVSQPLKSVLDLSA
jgi:hypothetical protein